MKVSIDTRHDTLEEALAVVTLAFGSSGKGTTSKPKRPAKKATSGRKARGRGAVLAEPEAASTITEAASPSKANGSRRRAGARKPAARKATVERTAAKKAPPRKSTARKAVATTRTVAKRATANRTGLKAKRVAAKKATPKKATAQPPKSTNVAPKGQSGTIRAWARSQGMQVGDAGRMSAAVIAAYDAQHN